MKNEKPETRTTGDKIINFVARSHQDAQQRKKEEAWAEYEKNFTEGVMRGAIMASKAMLDGKVAEDKIEILITQHWNLPPSETRKIIEKARIELLKDADMREFHKKNPVRPRIVFRDQQ